MTDTVLVKRYRLEERVGAGSMGAVWRATDELLGRTVAVKQLLLQPGSPGFDPSDPEYEQARQRILREGRLAARLQHPHAISVFDAVVHDDAPWLVMEYLESRTLGEVLVAEGAMDPRQAAEIASRAADGLAAAHAAGIVHRDIKPGNILIGTDGVVKITDFGVSRANDDVQLTRTGMIAGTPAFLAPEVARGETPTAASDVFALGSTLYACVEGEPPFGLDENAYALLYAVGRGEVPVPTHAGPLTATLMWMLHSDPVRRPSAARARDELAAIAAGRGSPAPEAPQQAGSAAGSRKSGFRATRSQQAGARTASWATTAQAAPSQTAPSQAAESGAAAHVAESPAAASPGPVSPGVASEAAASQASAGTQSPTTPQPGQPAHPGSAQSQLEQPATVRSAVPPPRGPSELPRDPAGPPRGSSGPPSRSPSTMMLPPPVAGPARTGRGAGKPSGSGPSGFGAAAGSGLARLRSSSGGRRGRLVAMIAAVLAVLVGVGLAVASPSSDVAPMAKSPAPEVAPSAPPSTPQALPPQPSTPSAQSPAPTEASRSPERSRDGQPSRSDIEQFVRSYYSLLPGDPDKAWKMLGDKARSESNGSSSYSRFYDSIRKISFAQGPSAVDDQTVTAALMFETKDGRTSGPERYQFVVQPNSDGDLQISSFSR